MLNWINLILLVISTALMAFFYIKSVGPAALEQKIGLNAYTRSAYYRITASVFEIIVILNYILYFFLPLPLITRFFFWDYWISIILSLLIFFPSLYVMLKGLKDAGRESIVPGKKHLMYGGIYKKIRHPQAAGELVFWWIIALLLNSPFLALFSFIWIPIFYLFCWAEEKDLFVRYGEKYIKYRKNTGFMIPMKNKSG